MANSMMGLPDELRPRFELLRPLGAGSQGRVLLARDRELDREVAIKVYRPPPPSQAAQDPGARRRFVDEAKLAARARHTCLVSVFDAGETAAGEPYIVFEYVPGPTWQAALEGDPPTLETWLRWVRELASGLDHLHGMGVIHRDVKPANVILRDGDHPVLCDLGLARPLAGDRMLTRTGELVGTPWNMAPEQWTGHGTTPATDQFGLAACALRTLTGRSPWESSSLGSAYDRVLSRRPLELPASVSGTTEAALRRGLAWRPAERFPSCAAFAAALSRALAPSIRRPPLGLRAARARRYALGLMSVNLVLLLMHLWKPSSPHAPASRRPPPPAAPVPSEAEAALDAALARVGPGVPRIGPGDPVDPPTAAPASGGERWVSQWLQEAGDRILDPRFPMRFRRLLQAMGRWTRQVAPGRPGARREFLDPGARRRFDHLAERVVVPLLYGLARATRPSLEQLLAGGPPGDRARLAALRQDLLDATRVALVELRAPEGPPPLEVVNLEVAVARSDDDQPIEEILERVHAASLEGLRGDAWDRNPGAHETLFRLRHALLEGARQPTSLACEPRVRVLDELAARLPGGLPAPPASGWVLGEAVAEATLLASRCPEQAARVAATLEALRAALPADPTGLRVPLEPWLRQARRKSLYGLSLESPALEEVDRALVAFEAAALPP